VSRDSGVIQAGFVALESKTDVGHDDGVDGIGGDDSAEEKHHCSKVLVKKLLLQFGFQPPGRVQ